MSSRSETCWQFRQFTCIHLTHRILSSMEGPFTATTAWHLLLMLVTSHSSTNICYKSTSVVVLVTLGQTAPSMGLRSRLLAGYSILSTPKFWRKSSACVILEDRVWSQTVNIWDFHYLLNFISISLCIEITSNDHEPSFSSKMLPHTTTLHPPKDVCLLVQQSLKCYLHLPHTLILQSTN